MQSTSHSHGCTLCSERSDYYTQDRRRAYYRCSRCKLIFADPLSHLTRDAEKHLYDQHENDPTDESYRQFLQQLANPLLVQLAKGLRGLDYGCGPGPTLSVMLEEAGMNVALYDPFYVPDRSVLQHSYDFVTCTEVAEHFHDPARDWQRLASLVRPGGWLGVMTRMFNGREDFRQWYYKNDPTHVSFYHPTTIRWLAERLRMIIHVEEENVLLFQKR